MSKIKDSGIEQQQKAMSKATERTLNFKDSKTELITLEELKISQSEVDSIFPPHYEIFNDIQALATKNKIETNIGNLYVHKGGVSKYPGAIAINRLEEKYGKGNIQSYLIRRVLGMIYFTAFSSDEFTYSLAINRLQDGLQVGLGHEVKICSNMTIMSYDNMLSSFGNGRTSNLSYQQMMDHIGLWLSNLKEKAAADMAIIDGMKATPVNHFHTDDFFGKFYRDVMNPSYKTSIMETDVKAFQRSYLEKIEHDLEKGVEKVPSVWDFVNLSTEIVHPTQTDPFRLLKANVQIINYIREEYKNANTVIMPKFELLNSK